MPPSLSGTVLKKKWKLGALVGTGGCAEVYEATDIKGAGAGAGQLVAKIAPLPVGLPPAMTKGKKRKKTDQEKHADMIYYEYTLYKGFLLKHGGVVEIPAGGYGEDHNLRYLVMTRLGPDVEGAQKLTGPWSVARNAGYARQMLALLRSLHSECKMVFVDVKPENFMFGLPGSADADKIFLIDFGLSSRYTGPAGSIKPQSIGAQVQGTPEFLSLKCHGGASAGRCDDLESLGYVILSMLNASAASPLPWSGATSIADGLSTKKSTSLETLCQGYPAGMLQYMKAVRALGYEETPDYDALDVMLEAMQKAGGKGAASAKGGGGVAAAKSGGRSSRSAARGAATSSTSSSTTSAAKPRASSARRGKGKPQETPEVEVCEVEGGRGSSGSGRGSRRSKKAAAASDDVEEEEEEFFDAYEEDDGGEEDVMEMTKAAKGARKPTRSKASGAGAAKRSSRIAAADRGFLLEVVSGPHKGETLRLPAGGADIRVGRNAPRKNGLRLDNDFEVSDKHAVLKVQADGIRCEDVGSLNGSFVNEDRLEGSTVLRDGDTLQVGQSAMKITC